jgi:hypothetical protein
MIARYSFANQISTWLSHEERRGWSETAFADGIGGNREQVASDGPRGYQEEYESIKGARTQHFQGLHEIVDRLAIIFPCTRPGLEPSIAYRECATPVVLEATPLCASRIERQNQFVPIQSLNHGLLIHILPGLVAGRLGALGGSKPQWSSRRCMVLNDVPSAGIRTWGKAYQDRNKGN